MRTDKLYYYIRVEKNGIFFYNEHEDHKEEIEGIVENQGFLVKFEDGVTLGDFARHLMEFEGEINYLFTWVMSGNKLSDLMNKGKTIESVDFDECCFSTIVDVEKQYFMPITSLMCNKSMNLDYAYGHSIRDLEEVPILCSEDLMYVKSNGENLDIKWKPLYFKEVLQAFLEAFCDRRYHRDEIEEELTLEELLQKAIDEEDYLEADRISKLIKKQK